MDIQFYDRVVYRPEYNYTFSYYQNRIDRLLASYTNSGFGTDPDDIIELNEVMQYISHIEDDCNITETQKVHYRTHIPPLKRAIGVYFSRITPDNVILIAEKVHPRFAFRFWNLVCYYKKATNIAPHTLKTFLISKPLHLDDILAQKDMARTFSSTLYECFCQLPNRISILVSALLAKKERPTPTLYITEAFSSSQINSLFRQYLQLEKPNINQVRLIAISQNDADIGLDDEIRLLAQRKEAELSEEILTSGARNEYGISVSFEPCKEWKHYKSEDRDFSAIYDSKWISENLDYPTLLDNFIYWLEYADSQCRSNLPLRKNQISAVEDMTIVKGIRTYDAGYGFKMTHFLHLITLQGYCNQLRKHNIHLEKVFVWFFEEYIPTEFCIDKLTYNAPTPESSYFEKCRLIAGEIEGILKQFKLFQKHGHIDRELLEISSEHLFFRDIPSLLSRKYVYSNSATVTRSIHYLFDDCMLGYYDDSNYDDFDCLYEAMIKCKQLPKALFTKNYNKQPIQCLLDFGVLVEDNGNLSLEPRRTKVLLELHNSDVICYHHCQGLQSLVDELIASGYLVAGNSLFSIPEQEYLDYILNKASFSDGLDLRNKYVHGSKPRNDNENFNDYLEFLLIMVMIIIKINDELCTKYPN